MSKRAIVTKLIIVAFVLASSALCQNVFAADAPAPPATVQLGAVGLPIVVDGRLVNYVFVTVKLHLVAGADGAAVRAKEPYIRDALLRAGHRSPFTLPSDYTKVDVARVQTEVMNDVVALLGRGVVRNVEVVKQVAQHRGIMPSASVHTPGPELIP